MAIALTCKIEAAGTGSRLAVEIMVSVFFGSCRCGVLWLCVVGCIYGNVCSVSRYGTILLICWFFIGFISLYGKDAKILASVRIYVQDRTFIYVDSV